ncbi:MAG: hypothetical protein ABRQ27_14915 [Clostridiaceae bacterium]
MGREVGALFFVAPFMISTIGGSLIGYAVLKVLNKGKALVLYKKN